MNVESVLRETANDGEHEVTVCDVCKRASCWQGYFMCDDAKWAGTIDLPISKLRELNREHETYWYEGRDR